MISRSFRWVVAIHLAFVAVANAGPRRVLVLPLDGNADGTTRVRINATIQKLTKATAEGAIVTVGDATFEETAAAVGCDPATPKCAVSVRQMLGVDELVYGTVTADPSGQTAVVVRRSSMESNPPKESTATLPAGEPADRTEHDLSPMFGVAPGDPPPPPPPVLPPAPPAAPVDHAQRNIGIACATGGGVVFLIGLGLWASASSKQDQIDSAPVGSAKQLMSLRDLEDSAQKYAIGGDLVVLAGLALGGYGAWVLYKDHQKEPAVIVTPAATPAGPGVAIGGVW